MKRITGTSGKKWFLKTGDNPTTFNLINKQGQYILTFKQGVPPKIIKGDDSQEEYITAKKDLLRNTNNPLEEEE